MHANVVGTSSGFIFSDKQGKCLTVSRADFDVLKHLKKIKFGQPSFVCGHSRLVTNGLRDNQPVSQGISLFYIMVL